MHRAPALPHVRAEPTSCEVGAEGGQERGPGGAGCPPAAHGSHGGAGLHTAARRRLQLTESPCGEEPRAQRVVKLPQLSASS